MNPALVHSLLAYRCVLAAAFVFAVALWLCGEALLVPVDISPRASPEQPSAKLLETATNGLGEKPQIGAVYSAIIERPLFSRSRRPFVPTPPAPSLQQPPEPQVAEVIAEPQVTLQGVFIGAQVRRALILTPAEPLASWRTEGDTVGGWQVAEIKANELILKTAGQQRVIKLYVEKLEPHGN
jgi:hypothetical protein